MDGNDKCGAKEAAPQPRRRAGTPRCAAPARHSGSLLRRDRTLRRTRDTRRR